MTRDVKRVIKSPRIQILEEEKLNENYYPKVPFSVPKVIKPMFFSNDEWANPDLE